MNHLDGISFIPGVDFDEKVNCSCRIKEVSTQLNKYATIRYLLRNQVKKNHSKELILNILVTI